MNSILSIIFITILVIVTYGITIYYDKHDLKKCTIQYVLIKEEEPEPEFENIKLYNVDNLSYLDFF